MNASEEAQFCRQAVVAFHNRFQTEVVSRLQHAGYYSLPAQAQTVFDGTNALLQQQSETRPGDLPAHLKPWLKRAILDARLELANRLDAARAQISAPDMIEALDAQLNPYREVMARGEHLPAAGRGETLAPLRR